MSWQNAAGMGMNPGNGMGGGPGGGEMGAAMQGNGNGQPNATEYTLQGAFELFLFPICFVARWRKVHYRANPIAQALCAFCRPNGIATNATETRGRLSARR